MNKKILCVDFDGVLHSYTSGWQGADVINDPPVPGAIEWLREISCNGDYDVQICSSRSSQPGGIAAMKDWLQLACARTAMDENHALGVITLNVAFPTEKPPAYLTIDDRAICFRGTFPSVLEMDNFKPWNK